MDSRFCSLTACLKNAKNTKGQSAICEGLEKYKKNTKIQIAFLDVMEKYQKKYKNTKCIVFVFYLYFVRIFFVFLPKKIRKKYQKNTNAIAQKYKIQKKYESTISKIRKTKKIRTQNFKNTKYKEKTNSKISERANPVFTFGNQEPKNKKKYKTNQLYFPNPAVLILYFWVVFFSYFFCIFKYW